VSVAAIYQHAEALAAHGQRQIALPDGTAEPFL
jgi:hypothetical protein